MIANRYARTRCPGRWLSRLPGSGDAATGHAEPHSHHKYNFIRNNNSLIIMASLALHVHISDSGPMIRVLIRPTCRLMLPGSGDTAAGHAWPP